MKKSWDPKTATIGFRILLAFSCIFFVLIIQSIFAIYSSRHVVNTQQRAFTEQITLAAFQDKLSLLRIRMFKLLGTLDPTKMETLKTEIEALFNEITEASKPLQVQQETLAKNWDTYQQIIALHWDFRTTQAYELINSTSEEEFEQLYQTLNTLIQTIETATQTTVRQTNTQFIYITLALGVAGIVIAGLWGRFLIRSIAEPIKQTVQYAQMIAAGDLSMSVTTDRNDEIGQLLAAMQAMITRLRLLLAELDSVILAIREGNLHVRGNAETFTGVWRDLIEGVNQVVEAFVEPITGTARYIHQIAQGELPEKISSTYQGDFNIIKQHLNMLIDATNDITQLASELAQGNLKIEAQERSAQDHLMQSLNAMFTKLNSIVQGVKTTAQYIASSSHEMSSTAESVSQGASQQAAAVEQVSAAMEEMVANIHQNTENTKIAEKLALESAEDAEKGGVAVTQTIKAMTTIIDRISIIREIAQQTNLLSLNAAIEASKAEEFGKGFGVVAIEVRELAHRTRNAAEEIDQLVRSCETVSHEAGAILQHLVPNSRKTAELIQEIRVSSSEQYIGAEQINKAIQQLETVIQQNASAAEEMASSSEQLSTQAQQLQQAMSFFTLRDAIQEKVPDEVLMHDALQNLLEASTLDEQHLAHFIKSLVALKPKPVEGSGQQQPTNAKDSPKRIELPLLEESDQDTLNDEFEHF